MGDTYQLGSQTLTAPGVYTEVFQAQNSCDSTVTLTLAVSTVNSAVSHTLNTITASSANGTYQWIDCANGNSPIAGETGQSFTAPVSGTYAVIVTENGCTDTSACVTVAVTGIDEAITPHVDVYPNPVTGTFFVDGKGTIPSQIDIYSTLGQAMQIILPASDVTPIDLSGEAPGVYLVRVRYGQFTRVVKVVKK
jgi:hypothetical protein